MKNESRETDESNVVIDDKLKKRYLKELGLDEKKIKKFVKQKRKRKKVKKKVSGSTLYKTNFYARLSNFFVENLSFSLLRRFEGFFEPLLRSLTSANIRILSRTYLSIILFSTILIFPISLVITFILTTSILLSLLVSLLIAVSTFALIYGYPFIISNDRKNKIDQELVFAIVHMAAVAGSGAHPMKIFQLLVGSGEYDVLGDELKRVLNYINIFGYSLSNSLKAVAKTTPSSELKELFYGMVSSIETGGDIRQYLADKADDTLTKYRFSQKKHLESIATYSEIYTGFLIAGPLLFIVTLAILEKISPNVSGIPINTLATLGTFVLLPLLNVLFILFLETMKSEV